MKQAKNPAERLQGLILEAGKRYPKAWGQADRLRGHERSVDFDWPDWCFLPCAGWNSIVGDKCGFDNLEVGADIGRLGALGAWRFTQSVYKVDPELYERLINTPLQGGIPTDLLLKLPEWCVYIETPNMKFFGCEVVGFWASLEYDYQAGTKELRILTDGGNGWESLDNEIMVLGDWGIEEALSIPSKAMFKGEDFGEMQKHFKERAKQITPMINLLLYVCSDGVEYRGKSRPKNPSPKSTHNKKKVFLPADKVRVWHLGDETGKQIKDASDQAAKAASKSGRSIKAHIRRAHWHSFWTGALDSDNRKKVLKWVPMVFVQPSSEADNQEFGDLE